ncbi:MAG: hypothetical protein K9W43_05605 [Candidatus Thorarchaeota archaeon]|nr:hypothetical protein [Candidatus Thorarchaeota archaeon]
MRAIIALVMIIVCFTAFAPSVSGTGDIQNQNISPNDMKQIAYTSVSRDVEFQLTKSFHASNYIDQKDYGPRSAEDVINSIEDYLPDGVTRVTDVDVVYTDVSISITKIHIIEDRDFGAGEVYLNIRLNDYDYADYRCDNDGNFYVGNDGDYISTSISIDKGLYSMNGWFSIKIDGWESDVDYDDYMGGEIIWYNLNGYSSRSSSGWVYLNDYPPDGGNNDVQLAVYITISFSNIETLSFPSDFTTSADGSWLIANVYLPKIYLDHFDAADNVPIKAIYEQVYYGYDSSISQNAYVIYYLFYWDHETDNFGVNFGHYYDYEPLLLFVKSIGSEPYRIVYRDVGSHTLPPKLVIQDQYASSKTGIAYMSVSENLTPLLGDSCNVSYTVTDTYFSEPAYHWSTTHGVTPYMQVPILSITNTYHQMELGIPLGSVEATLPYLEPLTKDIIDQGYLHLDEAFQSDINVYEGANLWNGADYRVPENMSLTLDMLHNPFVFPYVVDSYEEVVHYTESAQNYKQNGLYYDIDLGLSFIVPATISLNIPSTVTAGNTYDMGIDLTLSQNKIIIKFDYEINLGYVFHWWFIHFEKNATYKGNYELSVNLDDIAELVSAIGFSGKSLTGNYHQGWFTVSDFSTSADLLSTMLDCTLKIHLLRILSDLLGASTVGGAINTLKYFVSDVYIVAQPKISGSMTANLETENAAIKLSKSKLDFTEGKTHHDVKIDVIGGTKNSGVKLTNMKYNLNFATDWQVNVNFTNTLNRFVEDMNFDVGTFPDITASSDEHTISAETSTGYNKVVSLAVNEPITTSTTTGQQTSTSGTTTVDSTTTSSSTASNTTNIENPEILASPSTMIPLGAVIGLGVVAIVVIIVIKSKDS